MSSVFSPWQQRAYDHAVAALDTGRLGHGLLVCGPAGLGKRAVLDRLARRVLAQQRDARGEPAPDDRSARLIDAGKLKPILDGRAFDLHSANAAYDLLASGAQGRLAIEI